MKTKLVNTLALTLLITVGAYAQDTTGLSKKEIRQQERAERKARVKGELQNAGQSVGDAAKEVGRGAKEKAKVADEAVTKGAQKVGTTVNKGLDKAENAIVTEADRIKAKRDSARTEKARRDTL
ncbi:hypothetical protein [Spirosoma linguale]|uniref:Late embryogenesis abundant protein n=1 Tax=Spirosoma linguale (strain ATCC 33905 / DSM 74 / LMG 10896 / Claus 1) TaxID=504472 RepID=D2QM61_SPILD|nr:hypothetical protein Slin_1367 [Spirosoma linguale DSM 74]